MSIPGFSRRLTARTYRVVQIFVRLLSVLVFLLIAAFLFLRLYGVPDPLLREVVRRANVAGIPVKVDGVTLTLLRGWRAENLRYYSKHPDDLYPMFQSNEVFFSLLGNLPGNTVSNAWKMDVEAVGINLHPSVEWGIGIPLDSPSHRIERMKVSLGFLPDRILVSQGKMDWLGLRFNVDGTVLTGAVQKDAPEPAPKKALPVLVTEQQFQTLENRLKMLSLPGGATVDIDFVIDATNYLASRIDFDARAEDVVFRGIGFSKAELSGAFAYPSIQLGRAGLFQGKQSVQLSGEYDLKSKQAKGSLYNSITSNQLLLLLPAAAQGLLTESEVRIDQLPRLEINFGPAAVKDLPNHVSGDFSIRSAAYMGVEIETLRGQVSRANNRLEFNKLQGSVLGQEGRAAETGSAMHGGSGEGEVFWDGNTREFGVKVDASLDPHLLMRALAPVEIATNIIQRFRFNDRPPRGRVELGANVDDWDSFFIDIRALGNDVVFQGVEFSSVNVTEAYKYGKVHLDPIAAMQGVDFAKGSVVLDFNNSTVTFDARSSMNPAALEDLIYPDLNLFGNTIRASGDIDLVASGVFDWGSMRQTDFSAKVKAARLEIPVAATEQFEAEVVGAGPLISVKNARFGLYQGKGRGTFAIRWDPARPGLPYETDLSFSNVDFRKCLGFLSTNAEIQVSGSLFGNAHIEADMSTNFFATASGKGFVRVADGQLTDLPLFEGFSRLMRKIFPTFTFFSITSLQGNFTIADGVVSSRDAYFDGEVLSAKGRGSYSTASGFDAYIQVQVMSESVISKVVRAITDPFLKLLEIKLEGTLSSPNWRLEKFPEEISGLFHRKKE